MVCVHCLEHLVGELVGTLTGSQLLSTPVKTDPEKGSGSPEDGFPHIPGRTQCLRW